MSERFDVNKSAIYSIGDDKLRLTAWVNRHPFESNNAPRVDEPFLLLFSEGWVALQFLRQKLPEGVIHYAANDKAWEYYKGYANEVMGATRAIMNKCWQSHNDVEFQLISLEDSSFESLTEQPSGFLSPCAVCYDIKSMVEDDGTVTMLTRG